MATATIIDETSRLTPQAQAARLHKSGVVADLHVDTLLSHELVGYDMTRRHRNRVPRSPFFFQADIPRVNDACVDIWGLGLVTRAWGSAETLWKPIRRQLLYLNRVCEEWDDVIYIIRTRKDLAGGIAGGRVGAFPGLEGAHAIGERLDLVDEAYALGMRYFTLAHFSSNAACSCAMGLGSRKGRDRGLTPFGQKLVQKIHDMGIVLDLAHVNKKGFMDAAEMSRVLHRPVMVSHTCVSGVHKHWRNIDDEQIEAVAKTGGIVGIMFSPGFATGNHLAGLDRIADHILHVVKVAGADHAAYGSDMDGWLWTMPKGLADISDLPNLTQVLLERGLSADDAAKIIGGNAKRVIDAVLP
ncbi:dipeptidase [bacterium]|nr:dipeptidase [bacterium]